MVNITSCPPEMDARENVEDFVTNPQTGCIGGLRLDGLVFLHDLVVEELRKQEPDSEIVELDREYLIDNGVDFPKDLQAAIERKMSEGKRVNWIIMLDLPVKDWQQCLEVLNGRDTQVYFFTSACRQVPCCYKLIS